LRRVNDRPLPDLHRHLDGSLRRSTLEELAHIERIEIPENLVFTPGMGLGDALSRFAVTLSVLQRPERVERVASEICEDASEGGVSTLEIRFAPQLHRGASMESIVDAAISGCAGRAGIVLCGLYGDPPELLDALVEIARTRKGVVGIDLAGGPAPGARHALADYRDPFARAAELGLGRTVHAAEGRSVEEIRVAIGMLGAQRIGHGTTLLRDPSVLALVIDRGVTIEACPTSNVHTGAVRSLEDHPLPRWIELGVKVCVNTDNTLLSAVDAREEHRRALSIPGMDERKLARAIACGHEARFVR
jgi:adenosine deaminase